MKFGNAKRRLKPISAGALTVTVGTKLNASVP